MAPTSQTPDGILRLDGEVDLHRAPEIRAALAPLLAQKTPRLLVDMTAVSYIDSSGLALLIETLQRVLGYGGKFAVFGLSRGLPRPGLPHLPRRSRRARGVVPARKAVDSFRQTADTRGQSGLRARPSCGFFFHRSAAREAIARVAAKTDLSNDVREVVSRALED